MEKEKKSTILRITTGITQSLTIAVVSMFISIVSFDSFVRKGAENFSAFLDQVFGWGYVNLVPLAFVLTLSLITLILFNNGKLLGKRFERFTNRLSGAEYNALKENDLNSEDNHSNKVKLDTISNQVREQSTKQDMKQSLINIGVKGTEAQKILWIDQAVGEVIKSLDRERDIITTRTFLNLMIGSIIAVLGAYWLISVISAPQTTTGSSDPATQIINFVAKLTVAIAVQVFAYFFLNLYRNGLQEIKYYRNEMTNAISSRAGLRAALVTNDKVTLSYALKKFIDTERNFVLKKGESTLSLDQNRIDRDGDNRLAETVTTAVKAGIERSRTAARGAKTRANKKATSS